MTVHLPHNLGAKTRTPRFMKQNATTSKNDPIANLSVGNDGREKIVLIEDAKRPK